MKRYLHTEAAKSVGKPMPKFSTLEELMAWQKERQAVFHHMLGIDTYLQQERTPLNARVTGTIDCETFTIEKLYYESLPGLLVAGHLYIPKGLESPAPAVLYVCGHSPTQKIHYQEHARHFAQLGFVTLIVDTVQFGEVFGEHHGTYARGWFQWISKGYTPAAIEVWNAIRGLDLLSSRADVDADRLGVTGHSGGGSISWWTMCADDRVKVIATSSGTGHEASHIRERTLDRHCDCNFPNNPYGWSLIEQYALAAPRPVLIVAPARDEVFQIDSVREVYEPLHEMYEALGIGDRLKLFAFPARHMYTTESRKEVFSWFLRHLAGGAQTPDEVDDFDGVRLPEEQLHVYEGHPPAEDRSLTVQDWFIPKPSVVPADTAAQMQEQKGELIERLRKDSFHSFPTPLNPAGLNVRQLSWSGENDNWKLKFTYESEEQWELWGEVWGSRPEPEFPPADHQTVRPAAVNLRTTGDEKGQGAFNLLKTVGADWLKVRIDPRGTGDTAWGAELNWHIRRASALLGRTVASMRVWDTLRGIEALRGLPGVDPKRIVLCGAGEMAVVAIYAALLDRNIGAIVLEQAPGTLDTSDDGLPNMMFKEIIHALRHADLPQTAACLWPTKLVFVGEMDEAYRWTQRQYEQLGGTFLHVRSAEEIDFTGLV